MNGSDCRRETHSSRNIEMACDILRAAAIGLSTSGTRRFFFRGVQYDIGSFCDELLIMAERLDGTLPPPA